jgi:hypothetical protein
MDIFSMMYPLSRNRKWIFLGMWKWSSGIVEVDIF